MQYLALPIPDYPGYYASHNGEIISLKQHKPRILKPKTNAFGYKSVNLSPFNTREVHALVLRALVGVPGPGQMTRHLDGNPSNNKVFNLVWGTARENTGDKKRHGTWSHRLTESTVLEIMTSTDPTDIIAARYGLHEKHVQRIRCGKSWRHLYDRIIKQHGKIPGRLDGKKLMETQVEEILKSSGTLREIAERFGICLQMVAHIRNGRNWRHVYNRVMEGRGTV